MRLQPARQESQAHLASSDSTREERASHVPRSTTERSVPRDPAVTQRPFASKLAGGRQIAMLARRHRRRRGLQFYARSHLFFRARCLHVCNAQVSQAALVTTQRIRRNSFNVLFHPDLVRCRHLVEFSIDRYHLRKRWICGRKQFHHVVELVYLARNRAPVVQHGLCGVEGLG